MPAGDDLKGAGSDPAAAAPQGAAIPRATELQVSGAGPRPINTAPAGVATMEEFQRTLVELGLIDQAELASFAADADAGIVALSRALIAAGKLTQYQAAAVYQKKTRGLTIGSYVILEKLGQGGVGKVYKARHRPTGRIGALKMLPPSFARDPSAILRFRREVQTAGLLKHKNLVSAFDADEDRGVQFLVMDYIEGRDLDHVVRDHGPMPLDQAVECVIQAACGLEAAHQERIVHRDVKPANMMLDQTGTVRVLDLGLARVVDAVNPFNKSEGNRLTESGVYMGTIDYMAPEQAQDSHGVDHRADIYSLGCTLYFLLTGQEPFWGETVLKRLMAHMDSPAPSLRILRPDVSPAVDAVYLRMMAKRPEERPASMAEVIALLEQARAAPDFNTGTAAEGPGSKPALLPVSEQALKRAGPARTKTDPSVFARTRQGVDWVFNPDLNLAELVTDFRQESEPTAIVPPPAPADEIQPLKRFRPPRRRRRRQVPAVALLLLVLGITSVALTAGAVRFVWKSLEDVESNAPTATKGNARNGGDDRTALARQAPPPPGGKAAALNNPEPEESSPFAPPIEAERRGQTRTVVQPRTGPNPQPRVQEIAGWGSAFDPDGDCQIDSGAGGLTITVPPTLHDLNASIGLFNAPRVLREVTGDFEVRVKVVGSFTPGMQSNREGGLPFNGGGIVVCLSGDNFIRLERGAVFNGRAYGSFAIFEHHAGGSGVMDHNGSLDPGTTYLRLIRRGSRIQGYTSDDGRRWTPLQALSAPLPASVKVGLDAINSSSAPFTVRFEDYSFKTR